LLSDDGGKTFQEWVNMLGGKSVNGVPVLFPYESSVPYHLYWKVLNAKHHGVPQNRERVFLIGIRDDADNRFQFPREEHLTKRLKDVLEDAVDDKYFLSEKLMTWIDKHREKRGSSNKYPLDESDIGACMVARYGKNGAEDPYIKIKSATAKGYEKAREGDSINFKNINSETRRGRVGKGVAQTLESNNMSQGVMVCSFGRSKEEKKRRREHFQKTGKDSGTFKDKELILKNQEYYDTLLANPNPQKEGLISENYKIRRLTPRECFRLMDFSDTFTWNVSDSQAYKQAGNSIVVNVLYKILKQLPL
jgi:DNA (cytosine-5)-methyltransferase 1